MNCQSRQPLRPRIEPAVADFFMILRGGCADVSRQSRSISAASSWPCTPDEVWHLYCTELTMNRRTRQIVKKSSVHSPVPANLARRLSAVLFLVAGYVYADTQPLNTTLTTDSNAANLRIALNRWSANSQPQETVPQQPTISRWRINGWPFQTARTSLLIR